MTTRHLLLVLLFASLLAQPAPALADSAKLVGKGSVSYRLVHKFHKVTGNSSMLDVRAVVDDTGLKVMARTPVTSFSSGNANRDAHALEVLDAAHFPFVSVRATLSGFRLPTQPQTNKLRMECQVELHGVAVTHPVDVTVTWKDSKTATVAFEFDESLTAHKVERPSLMYVAVDDKLKITGQANLEVRP